jgi:hypothetical protein
MGEHNADLAFKQCGKLVEGKNMCAKRGYVPAGTLGEDRSFITREFEVLAADCSGRNTLRGSTVILARA